MNAERFNRMCGVEFTQAQYKAIAWFGDHTGLAYVKRRRMAPGGVIKRSWMPKGTSSGVPASLVQRGILRRVEGGYEVTDFGRMIYRKIRDFL